MHALQAGPPKRYLAVPISLVVALVALPPTPAAAAPKFVTQPSEIYEQLSALKEPRADVPVGALWVQDYGPHGEGAAPDNLVTVRSLSGFTLSGELQLRLTLGLATLLNLEPGYSRRISARFSDLALVRVKELSKLSGPLGEPRVYEALRAGTISITTDRDIGVDVGGALAVKNLPVVARADTGGKKSFTIDGRDLFIAFRVATSVPSRTEQKDAVLKRGGKALELPLRDYRLRLEWGRDRGAGAGGASVAPNCAAAVDLTLYRRVLAHDLSKVEVKHDFNAASTASLDMALPVPVADGGGGLLTKLVIEAVPAASGAVTSDEGCAPSELRVSARLEGTRLEDLSNPRAPAW